MGKRDEMPYVGVDLGGTNIQAGVLSAKNKTLARVAVKTKAETGSDQVIRRVVKAVDEAIAEAGLKKADVGGMGIGAPGAINVKKGLVIEAVNLRWKNYPLAEVLRETLKMPVTVDNDVNVGAWGEHQEGAAKGFDDMLGVFVGTGIGGGLVLKNKLCHGHFMTAGEIGHTVMRADAPLGRRTLENLASRTAVVNLLTQLIKSNHPSVLLELSGGDLTKVRSRLLSEAIAKNDPLAVDVVRQSAVYVGVAVANVVTMLSLPCVVIGGGLASALGQRYVDWVRAAFKEHVFPRELHACKVVATKLHDDAGWVGAALLARQRLADDAKM